MWIPWLGASAFGLITEIKQMWVQLVRIWLCDWPASDSGCQVWSVPSVFTATLVVWAYKRSQSFLSCQGRGELYCLWDGCPITNMYNYGTFVYYIKKWQNNGYGRSLVLVEPQCLEATLWPVCTLGIWPVRIWLPHTRNSAWVKNIVWNIVKKAWL